MNTTQKWIDDFYSTITTVDSKEAVSILKKFLAASIKAFEFDELEYFLDSIDLDKLPKPCIKAIITTIRPYSTEFEFWYEFVEEANKRIN